MITCNIKHKGLAELYGQPAIIRRPDEWNGHSVCIRIGALNLDKPALIDQSELYLNNSGLSHEDLVELAKSDMVVKKQRRVENYAGNTECMTDIFVQYIPEDHSTTYPTITDWIINDDNNDSDIAYDISIEVLFVNKLASDFKRYITINRSDTTLSPLQIIKDFCNNMIRKSKIQYQPCTLDFFDDIGDEKTLFIRKKNCSELMNLMQSFRVIKIKEHKSTELTEEKVIQYCLDQCVGIVRDTPESDVKSKGKTTQAEINNACEYNRKVRYITNGTVKYLMTHPHTEQVKYAIENLDLCDFDRWQAAQNLLFCITDNPSGTIPYETAAHIINALWDRDIEILELKPDDSMINIVQTIIELKNSLRKTVPQAFVCADFTNPTFTKEVSEKFINYIKAAPLPIFTGDSEKKGDGNEPW